MTDKVYESPYAMSPVPPAMSAHVKQVPWQIIAVVFDVPKQTVDRWANGRGEVRNWQIGIMRWIATHPENQRMIPLAVDEARKRGKKALDRRYKQLGIHFRTVARDALASRKRDRRHK